jgi:hypothetical protein
MSREGGIRGVFTRQVNRNQVKCFGLIRKLNSEGYWELERGTMVLDGRGWMK